MLTLSKAEYEELGTIVGTSMHESLKGKMDQKDFEKAVEDKVREIIKKSTNRGGNYPLNDVDPKLIFELDKELFTDPKLSPHPEVTKELQTVNDEMYILTVACKKEVPQQLSHFGDFEARYSELAKALNTATAGSGLEWCPTGFSRQMLQDIELEAVVASLFPTIQMPTNPYTLPVFLGDGEAYLGSEATDDDPSMFRASEFSTSDKTLTAVKLIANYPVSDEITEDSAIPVLPMMRLSIARAMAKAEDNAIINGDTSTTHLDTGYTVQAYDARRAWNGLRDMLMSTLKTASSSWSVSAGLALLRGMIEDMEIYGVDPSKVKLLCNTNMRSKLRALNEVSTNDKFGTAATIHNGIIKQIDGMDIVLSQHVKENLNSSGVYDGTTLTDTQLLAVYTPGFVRGIRKQVTIEYERVARKGIAYLVATSRRIFEPLWDTTTQPMIGQLYDITK